MGLHQRRRQPAALSGSERAGPLTRRVTTGIAVALAVLVCGVLAVHWWTHPTVFERQGVGTVDVAARPLSAYPVYVGVEERAADRASGETITLRSAELRPTRDTARARIGVVVCTQRGGRDGVRLGTASPSDGGLRRWCSRVRPVHPGGTVRVDLATEYLVATVRPRTRGTVRLGVLDLTYTRPSHLHQRGTQHISMDVALAVRG